MDDTNKIKLKVIGITYTGSNQGTYALLLEEEEGNRRLPIVIGSLEAQSIAIHLEGVRTARPLTHELFITVLSSFNIAIVEVHITRLEEGIFFSRLVCESNNTRITIDARTSDSIALALRFGCPIYTEASVLDRASIYIGDKDKAASGTTDADAEQQDETDETPVPPHNKLGNYSIEELYKEMEQAIDEEEYEYASRLRDEIKRRETES